jgi:peptidoglycan/xylan/chitin deacetylase (PgdA/CDA1 family)
MGTVLTAAATLFATPCAIAGGATASGLPQRWTASDLAYIRRVETTPGWVTVLEYHDVRPDAGGNPYVITPDELAHELQAVADAHRPVLTVYQLALALARHAVPWGAVVITFDDGYEGVYRYAYPLLRWFGYAATCFVIGIDTYVPEVGAGHLTLAQMRDLEAAGWDMESHSFNLHPPNAVNFSNAPPWYIRQDLSLEERLLHQAGSPAIAFSYPADALTRQNLSAVEGAYLLAFTSGPVPWLLGSPWAWPRVAIRGRAVIPDGSSPNPP